MPRTLLVLSLLSVLLTPSICFSKEDKIWKDYQTGNYEEALNGARQLASNGNHGLKTLLG
jgi:hypothetical protein